jgi:hypothetical protein
VLAAWIGGASMGNSYHVSATELDSHASMAVAGKNATLIARTGRHANVTPFSADLPQMNMVDIVDIAIAYDDPFTHKMFILVMRNALYIPTMGHNLVPPFLLHEA